MTQTEALKHEIHLVLTDPDTNLSHGARRALDYVFGQLEALAHPEQEPVGYLGLDDVENLVEYPHRCRNLNIWYEGGEGFAPLYTTPPQRTWVGLTDEDLSVCDEDGVILARYWEAKLKQKNGG